VPTDWDTFTVRYRYGSSLYIIHYVRDGKPSDNEIHLVDDGQTHEVVIH
jgi:hypothetical protein